MAAPRCLSVTERWIREKLQLQHQCLADVRSLRLPGTYKTGKIGSLGISLKNFVCLKSLDLSHNALVSVEGILHLKLLENLNLYFNRISCLHEVLSLGSLQNLKELDLRLNPVVKKDPCYRLYLVQAISKLRKLDDCAVRDRERKAALMHFSAESGLESSQKSPLSVKGIKNRSSNPRIASVNKIMISKLMFREGNEETVLNHNFDRNRNILTQEVHAEESCKPESTHLQEDPSEILNRLNGYDSGLLSSQEEGFQAKPKKCHKAETLNTVRPWHPKDAPRVTFVEPSVKRCTTSTCTPFRIQAESYFTPHPSIKNDPSPGDDQRGCFLKDYSERKLHPARLTYRTFDGETEGCSRFPDRGRKPCKGAYRKPMELLLSLVDEYWSGERKDRHAKHFFMHAVRILCMMEQEVTNGESETMALSEEIQALSDQLELQKREHQSEVRRLSEQLKQAHGNIEHFDQELRSVLEENVSLQKQLIRLEQQLLSDKLREMPNSQR